MHTHISAHIYQLLNLEKRQQEMSKRLHLSFML